jgi:hypothetical protein
MRAKVIKQFIDKETGRSYRKRDIITISKPRFEQLYGKFVTDAPAFSKLTPKRDSNGKCLICNNKK